MWPVTDQAVDTDGVKLSGNDRSPAPTDSQFLGRTRELKELRADIERAGLDTLAGRKAPRARVLLIAGKPGSGRTALAEELARQVADSYPDGVLRARLAEPDGTRVPTERTARELLTALELPTPPGADEDELSEALRDALADRRMLLLLDDAADAEQVDALLPDNPDCLAVAVSGGPLTGISDVRPCTLGGLDTKSAVELLERFTGSVRVTVDPRSAEALAEVCQGQPAALTLAGGWLAARPKSAVSDLAKQLHAESDEGTALSRVFRLVYASLPDPAARILRLLSLAPGGLVDPQTASALAGCSVGGARATLDDFVALSLLTAVDSPLPQYEVPGCLLPLLRPWPSLRTARPSCNWPAPGCSSGRCGCWCPAAPSPRPTARWPARNSSARPARCASRTRGRRRTGWRSAGPPCSRRPGWPWPTVNWTRWPAG